MKLKVNGINEMIRNNENKEIFIFVILRVQMSIGNFKKLIQVEQE